MGACSDSCTDLSACPSATIFHYLSAWRTCILLLVSLWRLKVFVSSYEGGIESLRHRCLKQDFFCSLFISGEGNTLVYGHHYLDVSSLGKGPAWPFGSDWCGIIGFLQDSLIWANLLGFCSSHLYPLLEESKIPSFFKLCATGPHQTHGLFHVWTWLLPCCEGHSKGSCREMMRSPIRPAPSNLQKQAFVACSQSGSSGFGYRWPFSDRHCVLTVGRGRAGEAVCRVNSDARQCKNIRNFWTSTGDGKEA